MEKFSSLRLHDVIIFRPYPRTFLSWLFQQKVENENITKSPEKSFQMNFLSFHKNKTLFHCAQAMQCFWLFSFLCSGVQEYLRNFLSRCSLLSSLMHSCWWFKTHWVWNWKKELKFVRQHWMRQLKKLEKFWDNKTKQL